jgi:hypothetical protein
MCMIMYIHIQLAVHLHRVAVHWSTVLSTAKLRARGDYRISSVFVMRERALLW